MPAPPFAELDLAALMLLTAVTTASSEGEIVIHGPASSSHLRLTVNGDAIVLDPLPIPLTAHLGQGSDKLIGNSEVDTCYPEGSKRNRCYGGGGNDVCITGQQNSDCVGDGGDDYCRHGAGSDGCWGDFSPKPDDPRQGTPGNDVCYMGPGEDGCHGGPGDDRLYGGPGADQLYGESGNDFCDGGPGIGRSHECETGPGH